MLSKERVRLAIHHEEPDRVPVCATFVPEVVERLKEKFGETDDIGVLLGNDMVVAPGGFETSYYQDKEEYYCRYGVKWKKTRNNTSTYTEMVEHPLAGNKSDLVSYQVPDWTLPSQYDLLQQMIEKYGPGKWMTGSCTCTIFETAWALRGLEQLLMDMVEDEDYTNELFDKIMQVPLHVGLKYIDMGVDMVWVGDDVAMQTGMLMSPELFRKYLKPRFEKLFAAYKSRRKDIVIMYHSCGNAEKIIDDLVDIGLDVLHPIQPTAMNVQKVKERYGKKLALWGTMDIQHIMPHGTVEEVRAQVKHLIEICSPGGGFVLAPAHHIQADTPDENIAAFFQAAKDYGAY